MPLAGGVARAGAAHPLRTLPGSVLPLLGRGPPTLSGPNCSPGLTYPPWSCPRCSHSGLLGLERDELEDDGTGGGGAAAMGSGGVHTLGPSAASALDVLQQGQQAAVP